jgi:drug/metabolite transporter (DMT)-like permease
MATTLSAPPQHGTPAADRDGYLRGVVMVLTAAGTMGLLGPVAGLAYAEGVTPPTFSALRALIGAGLLGLLIAAGRMDAVPLRTIPARQRRSLVLAIVVNGVMNLVLFLAFGAMAVAVVMVIFFTYPVLTALISTALGRERLTPRRIAALAVAGLGLALVLGGRLGPNSNVTADGVLLATGAAVCHAVYLVVIRGGFPSVPAGQATALVLSGGIVISGAAALVAGATATVGSWIGSTTALVAILLAGTVGALPKVLVIRGVRLVGSTRAAVLMLMEPVTAVIAAAILLRQVPTPLEVLGGILVLAAVLIVQRPDPGAEIASEPIVTA